MSNAFDHLHIKRHTAGSSNELSFDVLDAAREGYAPKKKLFGRREGPQMLRPVKQEAQPQKPSEAEAVPQPAFEADVPDPVERVKEEHTSYHRAVGKSALSSQVEVTSRKRERRVRSIRIGAVATVIAVAMMVATAYVGYRQYEEMQLFQSKFDSLVQLFVKADEAIPLVDSFMLDPFGATSEEIDGMGQAIAQAEVVLKQLDDERALAFAYTVTDRDQQALDQVEKALAYRQDMMVAATAAAKVVSESNVESSEVNAVWHKVLGADEAARSATAAANAASTDEGISNARDQTKKARDDFKAILEELKSIAKSRTDLDLAGHIAYLEKRIESLDHAVATSEALLKSDKEEAKVQNDAYNEADREAVALAEQLPLSAEQTVDETYEDKVLSHRKDYETARDGAIQSDALIRQYLRS